MGDAFDRVIVQGSKFLAIIRMNSDADRMVRLNEDGTLDRSFGKDGFLPVYPESVNLGGGGRPNGSVLEILPVANGRFLAKVQRDAFEQLVRFSADGKLDTTFGTNGSLGVGGIATAIDSQGRIYATKFVTISASTFMRIDRFTADGVPLPLPTPVLVPHLAGDEFSLNITSDMVVASTARQGTNWSGTVNVRRFSLDGAISSGFGINGIATIQFNQGGALASFRVHRTQGGPIRIVGGVETGGPDSVWSMRLQSNGQPDPSYGPNGIQETQSDSFLIFDSIDLPDGRIAIVGEYENGTDIGVGSHYLNNAGILSAVQFESFAGRYPNTKSFERTPFGLGQMLTRVDDVYQIQSVDGSRGGAEYLRTTGKVIASQPFSSNGVVVVSTEGTPARTFLTKFNAVDFAKDQGFGTSGRIAIDLSVVSGLQVHNGKIYVWGHTSNGSRLLRYLSNGLLDTSFGLEGAIDFNVLSNLEFDSLNRIFFVRYNSGPELVAYTAAGVQDSWHPVPLPAFDSLFQITIYISIDKEGNLFAAGSPTLDLFAGTDTVVVQRVLNNQTIDPNFGIGGTLTIPDHYVPDSMIASDAIASTNNGIAILAQKRIDDIAIITIALNAATNRFELDNAFDGDGIANVTQERVIRPQGITRLNDGSFLVSMFTESGRGSQGAVLRFMGPSINPVPFHNVFFPMDVTSTPGQPRSIDPLDVLAIVNHINSGIHAANTFPDVDGDATVSPLDALILVNFLNAGNPLGGEAEGEGEEIQYSNASTRLTDQYFVAELEGDLLKRFRVGRGTIRNSGFSRV